MAQFNWAKQKKFESGRIAKQKSSWTASLFKRRPAIERMSDREIQQRLDALGDESEEKQLLMKEKMRRYIQWSRGAD